MAAQQQNIDTIADDLANSDVVGFKGATQTFAELAAPGMPAAGTVSLGSRVLLGQGKLERGGGPCDLAIDGPGFFAVRDAHGHAYYTRAGDFARVADGTLRNGEGLRLEGVAVPPDALSLHVDEDGAVRATFPNGAREVGRVPVVEFAAPDRLRATGGATFEATRESGPPRNVAAAPANAAGPKIRFGMLERSNVSIVESMMRLLSAQRAYEANAKGIQAADEMLRIANNLQRG